MGAERSFVFAFFNFPLEKPLIEDRSADLPGSEGGEGLSFVDADGESIIGGGGGGGISSSSGGGGGGSSNSSDILFLFLIDPVPETSKQKMKTLLSFFFISSIVCTFCFGSSASELRSSLVFIKVESKRVSSLAMTPNFLGISQ
jgi:hypothetical protein